MVSEVSLQQTGQIRSVIQPVSEQEIMVPPELLAGRTCFHLQNWRKITADPWVLEAVQGYRLELTSRPQQLHIPSSETDEKSADLILEEIESMLDKKAIQGIQQDPTEGFFSRIFLVPK